MIEEYDEIREVTNPAKKEDLSELTKLQTEYLKELNIPSNVSMKLIFFNRLIEKPFFQKYIPQK